MATGEELTDAGPSGWALVRVTPAGVVAQRCGPRMEQVLRPWQLHVALVVLTFGLWAFVWLGLLSFGRERRYAPDATALRWRWSPYWLADVPLTLLTAFMWLGVCLVRWLIPRRVQLSAADREQARTEETEHREAAAVVSPPPRPSVVRPAWARMAAKEAGMVTGRLASDAIDSLVERTGEQPPSTLAIGTVHGTPCVIAQVDESLLIVPFDAEDPRRVEIAVPPGELTVQLYANRGWQRALGAQTRAAVCLPDGRWLTLHDARVLAAVPPPTPQPLEPQGEVRLPRRALAPPEDLLLPERARAAMRRLWLLPGAPSPRVPTDGVPRLRDVTRFPVGRVAIAWGLVAVTLLGLAGVVSPRAFPVFRQVQFSAGRAIALDGCLSRQPKSAAKGIALMRLVAERYPEARFSEGSGEIVRKTVQGLILADFPSDVRQVLNVDATGRTVREVTAGTGFQLQQLCAGLSADGLDGLQRAAAARPVSTGQEPSVRERSLIVDATGRAGPLRVGNSSRSDVLRALGPPELERSEPSGQRVLGYSCDEGSINDCGTQAGLAGDTLSWVWTSSPEYTTPAGLRVGASASEAAQREGLSGSEYCLADPTGFGLFLSVTDGRIARLGTGSGAPWCGE